MARTATRPVSGERRQPARRIHEFEVFGLYPDHANKITVEEK